MLAYVIITFRETLEVGLLISLVWRVIHESGATSLYKWLTGGLIAGLLTSVAAGIGLVAISERIPETYETVFEGSIMLIGAGLLTTLIIWLSHNRGHITALKASVASSVQAYQPWAIFLLVYTSILREGIETVIFIQAARYSTNAYPVTGALIGVIAGIALCYMAFKGLRAIPMRHFFTVSSVLLIAFAAGLVAHGVHELQSAGIIPVLTAELWDINPKSLNPGQYPLWHEKGLIGSLLKGLFGYNGNPTQLEVLVYSAYIAVIALLYRRPIKAQS